MPAFSYYEAVPVHPVGSTHGEVIVRRSGVGEGRYRSTSPLTPEEEPVYGVGSRLGGFTPNESDTDRMLSSLIERLSSGTEFSLRVGRPIGLDMVSR
ncbi:unnamed protein product [Lota lota]